MSAESLPGVSETSAALLSAPASLSLAVAALCMPLLFMPSGMSGASTITDFCDSSGLY